MKKSEYIGFVMKSDTDVKVLTLEESKNFKKIDKLQLINRFTKYK